MEGRIFFKQSRKLIVVTILFLLLATLPAYARLWGNKVDINTQDFKRIITELRIYDDPNLPYYNEIFSLYYSGYTGSEELLDALNKKIEITQQVMKILDADIKKEELGNLTYGRYILNAINEKELVEIGIKMGSPGQANGEYFSKLGKNLADWKSQLSKLLLTKIIVATCTAMGAPALSIGISTLGLFCDLSIIGTSINKLNEVWYEKAFWSYIIFRNEPNNYGHTDAWTQLPESYINHIFILSPEKQKKARESIEENFKSLWNKYGDHIVNNELDKNFKSQQRESLKILLLYALEAEPHPIITSPLKITSIPPYYIEDTINAEFTIANQGKLPIKFSVLTVGGRDPDNQVTDFTHRQNIALEPFESYNYQGTLTLKKLGDYHFFCTYQTLDGNWNTSIDLGSGLVDEDRTEDIIVEEKEKPPIVSDISEELFIEWDKTFGGSEADRANTIIQTTDGGYVLTGMTRSKGAGKWDIWVIKLDQEGNMLWDKTFGGSEADWAYSIIQTGDGGYAVAGSTESKGAGKKDAWIIKLDYEGNMLWDKTFGGSGFDYARAIIQTANGGYILTGYTLGLDAWIIKLDYEGNMLWDKTFGGSKDDRASTIIRTADGGYILTGMTLSKGAGGCDAWIIKLDQEGNMLWDKTFGGSEDDWANSIIQTTDGGYAVAGYTSSKGAGEGDIWLIKLDSEGNMLWDKTFGGSEDDWAGSIIKTTGQGYMLAGITSSKGAGGYDSWIIKLNLGSIEVLEEEVTEVSSSENYYPLDEGRRWEYQVYVKKKGPWDLSGPIKISAKQVCTIFPQREIKGKKVTPMQIEQIQRGSVYTRFLFYVKDQNSIYEFASQKPEDVEPKIFHDYIIKYPIKVGNSWQETETSSLEPRISVPIKSTIESIDEVVTVPAGTFKECLKIKSIGFAEKVFGEEEQKWPPPAKNYVKIERELYIWLAPNVGLIKTIFKEKKASSLGTPTSEISHFLEIVMQLETFK